MQQTCQTNGFPGILQLKFLITFQIQVYRHLRKVTWILAPPDTTPIAERQTELGSSNADNKEYAL